MNAKPRIYLSAPDMGREEAVNVQCVFESNWIAPLGPEVEGFERDLAAYCQVKKASAVSSGTAAIHLALRLLGVGSGDLVLVSSFTFVATGNPIVYLGAEPVFIDSEPQTWNMCPDSLREAILSCIKHRKKPKAILVVDLYGMPAQYEKILALSKEFDIPVVEDAAEALGSSYNGQPAGSFGECGILSFNGNKIITTSGGGALLSNNEKLIERSRFLATQARDPAPHYQHSEIGYNYRMSNVLAAIGRGQLAGLSDKVRIRREHFQRYQTALKKKNISFLCEPENIISNRWLTTAVFPRSVFDSDTPERIRLELEKENIESRPLWKPLHLQPVFKDCNFFGSSVSEELFKTGLCLPSGSGLKAQDIDYVVEEIVRTL